MRMNPFLENQGWSVVAPVAQDGSSRQYFRVEKNGRGAIFMDASAAPSVGHRAADFIRIGAWLRGIGLRAPEIYAADEGAGFLILEDFGDLTLKKALARGEDARVLYGAAHEILQRLREARCDLDLPDYYQSHVHRNHRFVIDWYAPELDAAEYLAVWAEIEKFLPPVKKNFVHVDFHAENLMWLEGGAIGILDFQGAMRGPAAYDLASLLEDARLDVPAEIRAEILKDYDEEFLLPYHVLAMQFHCRVIGQFIKLAGEGKAHYLEHIPRLEAYIRAGLEQPVLAPLKAFFSARGLDFMGRKAIRR